MTPLLDAPALVTAFLAGLLGSGHCFAMCGAIAATPALGSPGKAARWSVPLVFNSGRLASYAVLGTVVALLAAAPGGASGLAPSWGQALRLLTAAMILLIGLQFLTHWNLLGPLERLGGHLWARVRPWTARTARFGPLTGRLLLGLCWGLLPCGLVYSILLLAASSGHALSGALVMLAFGAGTLPSMLGMGFAGESISLFVRDAFVRRFIGAGLVLLSAWTIMTALTMSTGTHAMH